MRKMATKRSQKLLTGKRWKTGFTGKFVEKKLGEIGIITASGVDKKINVDEMPITLLNYLDVYRNTYIRRNMLNHIVTAKREKLLQCNVQKGDVFFTPTSETADDIAKTAVAVEDMSDVVYSYHVVRLRPFEEYNGIFVKYACDTAFFIEQTKKLADGCGTRYVISLPKFREKLIILVPPTIEEQFAIVDIISDTDALISAQETLIAKKRAIKQSVMQELLTGKKRLSGFSGKWVEKSLGDFGHCVRGVSYNPSTDLFIYGNHNTLTLLRANNIVNDKIEPSNVLYVNKSVVSTEQKLLQGDIVIAMSSGSVVAIGKTGYYIGTSEMYCVGAFCAIFRSEINHYIRFLFQSTMFREQLATFLEGTSINNLNSRIIEGMTFHFPQKKEEIIAIATILSDMDTELDALTTKLTKLRQIKQAMMSDLLTGRIRLPIPSTSSITIKKGSKNGKN